MRGFFRSLFARAPLRAAVRAAKKRRQGSFLPLSPAPLARQTGLFRPARGQNGNSGEKSFTPAAFCAIIKWHYRNIRRGARPAAPKEFLYADQTGTAAEKTQSRPQPLYQIRHRRSLPRARIPHRGRMHHRRLLFAGQRLLSPRGAVYRLLLRLPGR